ncbi:putative TIM-barrel protein, nifR3 family [Friedmanniella luteola]|uniref:tRNA-dihydrouridine synthase n=1 Tax=Friedmanniella luteola TaxID=546871 RepID=A0A1H1X2P4_9ACTN|nr:tRNA dihydrouridine synthase DusB [Friedmanniella luteola]SDT03330.1 putative TIM-barrel protein, nifR3 family [Friedmanniella luteola]
MLTATELSAPVVAPTTTGADRSLQVGPITVPTPVVLAPMAGVTNAAYRQLCREQGAGLYVCEMITSRGVVARDRKTLQMLQFDPGETVRSVQLYGVDPAIMAQATEILVTEHGVGHVDLNFGCPVPKVTRKGGGAALPWKRDRLRMILDATVAAGARHGVPVTIKTRIGIDADHQTFLDAGRIAEQAGVAAIALHGRTAQQAYSGEADWTAIAALKAHVSIPVLGNGDIWEASDALAMVEQTGADGVVIGRGCLGRPWLFRDLADAFAGRATRTLPTLGEVAAMIRRHAELLVGLSDEQHGLTELRKHMAWYLKGFPVGSDTRRALGLIGSFADLDAGLARLDPDAPFPVSELGSPRGRQGSPRDKVALPEHWLDDTSGADLDMADAEQGISGG